jgi:hypothetical protein
MDEHIRDLSAIVGPLRRQRIPQDRHTGGSGRRQAAPDIR